MSKRIRERIRSDNLSNVRGAGFYKYGRAVSVAPSWPRFLRAAVVLALLGLSVYLAVRF